MSSGIFRALLLACASSPATVRTTAVHLRLADAPGCVGSTSFCLMQEVPNVSSPTQLLVAELSHEINSPLAAIRSALYLASHRSEDVEVHRYLEIADNEVVRIAGILRDSRAEHESYYELTQSRSEAV